MKRLLILIALLIASQYSFAQLTQSDDGRYFDQNKKPYTGLYSEKYPNGNLRIEMNITDGMLDGTYKTYFENGQLNEIRSYKAGKMDGVWETFNDKGVKTAEANFKDGVKHGKWFVWDDAGTMR